jgi:uncharacterized membrane protein YbhN (UPF0104 family)
VTVESEPRAGRIRVTAWLNLVLAVVLVLAGLWFLSRRVSLAEIGHALADANPLLAGAAFGVMLLTIALKALRWQLILSPARGAGRANGVHYSTAFWALALGQYVNLIVPFLRLGEIARIYVLNQEAAVNPGRAASTLVVEKALDLLFFGLTILFVLPFVVLPSFIGQPGPALLLAPLALLMTLYLLAFRTAWVESLLRRLTRPLPERLAVPLLRLGLAGLDGLSALRDPRLSLALLGLSLAIAALGVVLPYLLFPAFGLSLTWVDAALIHIVVSIAVAPPSTPVKIGVFNGAAAFMLWSAGVRDEPTLAGYSILFYLAVIGPQVVLGLIASVRSHWRWGAPVELAAQGR